MQEGLHKARLTSDAGRGLECLGKSDRASDIIISGQACSERILHDGQRQIVDFQISGDFLGLRSVVLHTSDHSIEPATYIGVTEVLMPDLLEAFASYPRLAMPVFCAASRDEAMVVGHLVDVGRRHVADRTAHFLLELGAQLTLVGMGDKARFADPLSKYFLADAGGLSSVHVNRVLRQLREKGMLTFRNGFVAFDD